MIRYTIFFIVSQLLFVEANDVAQKAIAIKNALKYKADEFTQKLLGSLGDLTFSDNATKDIHPGS